MGQPVRKTIENAHPEISIKPIYTLLVDGTNLLRISMVDTKINSNGDHYGGVFQFLLQIKKMLMKKVYDYIYVFFDAEDSGMLRYKIYEPYKAQRDKHYEEHEALSEYAKKYNETLRNMQRYIFEKKKNEEGKKVFKKDEYVEENFKREEEMLCRYFNELFIRWQIGDETEGDDLIAYYVKNKKPEENIVIMSSDRDITQLISDTVCVYDIKEKVYLSTANFKRLRGYPVENVTLLKILLGDTSDNIGKINRLSEDNLYSLMPEIKEKPVTIEEVRNRARAHCDERIANKLKPLARYKNLAEGIATKDYNGDFFEINRKLVDLSEPMITDSAKEELDTMRYNVQDPTDRSFANLYKMIIADDITELRGDNVFSSFFEQFKSYVNKEKEKYQKEFLGLEK